jgi:hypothetical protein
MTRGFPARLHVLLASKAPVGVVFRRGPANAVCTVGWNRETDEFELGQWFQGRIYERRADLSPDGRHLIYFARGGRRHQETKGSWTAISRAPWLHAITLYGKGDCWQGGGLFTSNAKYWLNGCHFVVRQSAELAEDEKYKPEGSFGAECPGCYWDEHELEHPARKALLSVPTWEWAERDGPALVWAEKGVLHRALVNPSGPASGKALHDFNAMQFESRVAPY